MKTVLPSRFRPAAFCCSFGVVVLTASVALGAFALGAPRAEATGTAASQAASSSPSPSTPLPSSQPPPLPPSEPTKAALPATLDKRIEVTKIHEVRNDESYHPRHNDALEFEKEYWNYGAVTKEQLEARRGQIYVISWKNSGAPDRFVAKFEYRQEKTRDAVKEQTQEYPAVSGNARAYFKVVGAEYRQDGPVEAWRFTVWRGNKMVAEEQSFIW